MADRVPFGTGQAGPALRRAIGIGSVAHGEDLDEELFLVEAVDDAVVAPSGRTAAAPWLGQLLAQAVRVQDERAGDQLNDGARDAGRKALEVAIGAARDHEPPGWRLAGCHLLAAPRRRVAGLKRFRRDGAAGGQVLERLV